MGKHLQPGMAVPASIRSAAREKALRRRKRRAWSLVLAALILSMIVGVLIVRPVFAPQAEMGILYQQPTEVTASPTIPVLTEEVTAEVLATEIPPVDPIKQPTLPTQAQAVTYPKDAPILYYAQSGDSLAVLAIHFGVEISDIDSPSPLPERGFISPGQLLLIPSRLDSISSPLKLLPDTEVVNSPSAVDFDIAAFIDDAGGYLSTFSEYLGSTGNTSGADIIERVACEYSINPRLLLALLEYHSGWVYGQPTNLAQLHYPMGYVNYNHKDLYKQSVWAAGEITSGYFGWREGTVVALTFPDKSMLRLAPDLNCGTVGLMYLGARLDNISDWAGMLYTEESLIALYTRMFGNPWMRAQAFEPLFTPDITQPEMILPFEINKLWAYTGGPHAAWGAAQVRAALDFAPPSEESGCVSSSEWVVASAEGLVVRSGEGAVVIDMDGDGFEQTGWNIVYMHIATQNRIPLGSWVEVGDRIGHPSCEGGRSTGTHVHIARKYNGEWVPADGPLPFVLDGWRAKAGSVIYTGWLIKDDQVVRSSLVSSGESFISRGE